jgi:hypothetical protein
LGLVPYVHLRALVRETKVDLLARATIVPQTAKCASLIYNAYLFNNAFLFFKLHKRVDPGGRVVRRKSADAWLLGSRVRIPQKAWMFVSCVYMLYCPV